MLLRRVTKHVKDQNWFAVSIDFAIVVVGVFVGLQVSNWNADMAQQSRGEKIKVRLVAEFKDIESELTRHIQDITTWIGTADQLAADILADEVERNTSEFSDRLSSIRWRPPSGGSNTIAELISQGDMDILRSPNLVEELLRFETLAQRHTSNNLAMRRFISADRNALSKASILAAIPLELRGEEFEQSLIDRVKAPDIYLATVSVSDALKIDLLWYQASLDGACNILQELNDPCSANPDIPGEPQG
ncbi:MAG: hypothetical protein AAGJ68_14245 [Pseudomonadota bacterium]